MSIEAMDADVAKVRAYFNDMPNTESVAGFVKGPGIDKLQLKFDITELQRALQEALQKTEFKGDLSAGFGAFSLTRRPGVEVETANDLSGLFFTRVDETYEEVRREDVVDEFQFTELVPASFLRGYIIAILGTVIQNQDCTFPSLPIQVHFSWSITMQRICQPMVQFISPTHVGIIQRLMVGKRTASILLQRYHGKALQPDDELSRLPAQDFIRRHTSGSY